MNMPKIPAETGPFLWGAAAGAIALSIVGFAWGGWVTGSTAERMSVERADKATLTALVPICVAQFQKGPEARGRMAALKDVKTWEQGEFVSKGGWATMPGSSAEPDHQVAQACAEALNTLATNAPGTAK